MGKAPFKMKSSPTKGRLEDFFKGFASSAKQGVSKLTGGVQKEIHKVASDVSEVSKIDVPKKFAGDVKKTVKKISKTVNPGRKGKKYTKAKRKAGESQYQANVRARREEK